MILAFFALLGLSFALDLPPALAGKAEVVALSDPDYARAEVSGAIKPAGQGGISDALVVRLTADVPVYRMWSGPEKLDSAGRTNRLGSWWSYDAPKGTQAGYRAAYEICLSWNDLTWMETCTLKKGAVVAIGPGQSVSATTCGDLNGKESYPANPKDWQTYIAKPWNRIGVGKELECPDPSMDYKANPADISQKLP